MEPSRPAGPPPDPMQQLLQVGSGYFLSSALWVATELDIAGLLSQGPKTGAELASATQHQRRHPDKSCAMPNRCWRFR